MDINLIIKQVGDFARGPTNDSVFGRGTGVYLTLRIGSIQIRGFTHAWALISGKSIGERMKEK
jgi:Na+/alanine symporter